MTATRGLAAPGAVRFQKRFTGPAFRPRSFLFIRNVPLQLGRDAALHERETVQTDLCTRDGAQFRWPCTSYSSSFRLAVRYPKTTCR